ncbi:hypothetical protein BHE74_00015668 [Ensete ventricosum]|nr:hypothetical protein GW17_00059952 [Ensete ventricosum]RWW76257.1 hypothetical protein BHE74_00015668 [Ensete ventricosum]RZR96385.1 hypothetical protein BHM03_00025402 [Ensete ventricosum]
MVETRRDSGAISRKRSVGEKLDPANRKVAIIVLFFSSMSGRHKEEAGGRTKKEGWLRGQITSTRKTKKCFKDRNGEGLMTDKSEAKSIPFCSAGGNIWGYQSVTHPARDWTRDVGHMDVSDVFRCSLDVANPAIRCYLDVSDVAMLIHKTSGNIATHL